MKLGRLHGSDTYSLLAIAVATQSVVVVKLVDFTAPTLSLLAIAVATQSVVVVKLVDFTAPTLTVVTL